MARNGPYLPIHTPISPIHKKSNHHFSKMTHFQAARPTQQHKLRGNWGPFEPVTLRVTKNVVIFRVYTQDSYQINTPYGINYSCIYSKCAQGLRPHPPWDITSSHGDNHDTDMGISFCAQFFLLRVTSPMPPYAPINTPYKCMGYHFVPYITKKATPQRKNSLDIGCNSIHFLIIIC